MTPGSAFLEFRRKKTKRKNKNNKPKKKTTKGVGVAVQLEFGHEIPCALPKPEDDMQTIDTCIPVVHALFFFTNRHLLRGISSFFDNNC